MTGQPTSRTETVMLTLAMIIGILSGMCIQQYRDTPTRMPPAVRMGGTSLPTECAQIHRGCRAALLAVINADRAAHGALPLTLDWTQSRGTTICPGSAGHSRAMVASFAIWHVDARYPAASFPADLCTPYQTAGENVGESATGNRWSDLAQLQAEMLMEPWSPGCNGNHACNLRFPGYRRIGIGIAGSPGATWLTEDFLG